MKLFYEQVDKNSRKAMIELLQNHFRYYTANSWNGSTSYACNLKIHRLGLDREIVDKLYDMIHIDGFYDTMNDLKYDFGESHDFQWQARFNGKSGGYLVLYEGERQPSGHKSYCYACGQKNYKSTNENGNICGACDQMTLTDCNETRMAIQVYSGRSVDMGEDFEDWEMECLRERVELVQSFDALADGIVAEAVHIAKSHEIYEETIFEPKTHLRMRGIEA